MVWPLSNGRGHTDQNKNKKGYSMKYTYHFDLQNNQWNCFEVVDGYEIYICSKPTAEQARLWCEQQTLAAILNVGAVREDGE
jgi:hypothetical protein